MKKLHQLYRFSLLLIILTLSACSSMDETAATRLCKDPHDNTTNPAKIQGCTRNSDCHQACGAGWSCWRNDDANCHSHSPGTPFPDKEEETMDMDD